MALSLFALSSSSLGLWAIVLALIVSGLMRGPLQCLAGCSGAPGRARWQRRHGLRFCDAGLHHRAGWYTGYIWLADGSGKRSGGFHHGGDRGAGGDVDCVYSGDQEGILGPLSCAVIHPGKPVR